jgi:hypothetical protein
VPFVAILIGVAIRFGGQRRLLALLRSWLSLLMCVPPDVIIYLCGAWGLKRERFFRLMSCRHWSSCRVFGRIVFAIPSLFAYIFPERNLAR